jgi:addiction module RelE/StbE family toxin
MVKINWTNFALQDLNEIADFISKDSVRYAQMTVKYLFESPTLLKTHPKAGRIVPEFKEENLRELIGGSYRIVYRIVDKNRIDILTVHHSARLFKNSPLFKK